MDTDENALFHRLDAQLPLLESNIRFHVQESIEEFRKEYLESLNEVAPSAQRHILLRLKESTRDYTLIGTALAEELSKWGANLTKEDDSNNDNNNSAHATSSNSVDDKPATLSRPMLIRGGPGRSPSPTDAEVDAALSTSFQNMQPTARSPPPSSSPQDSSSTDPVDKQASTVSGEHVSQTKESIALSPLHTPRGRRRDSFGDAFRVDDALSPHIAPHTQRLHQLSQLLDSSSSTSTPTQATTMAESSLPNANTIPPTSEDEKVAFSSHDATAARPIPVGRSSTQHSQVSSPEAKTPRSVLRRSSSSVVSPPVESPRRVRFDVQGDQVSPNSSPAQTNHQEHLRVSHSTNRQNSVDNEGSQSIHSPNQVQQESSTKLPLEDGDNSWTPIRQDDVIPSSPPRIRGRADSETLGLPLEDWDDGKTDDTDDTDEEVGHNALQGHNRRGLLGEDGEDEEDDTTLAGMRSSRRTLQDILHGPDYDLTENSHGKLSKQKQSQRQQQQQQQSSLSSRAPVFADFLAPLSRRDDLISQSVPAESTILDQDDMFGFDIGEDIDTNDGNGNGTARGGESSDFFEFPDETEDDSVVRPVEDGFQLITTQDPQDRVSASAPARRFRYPQRTDGGHDADDQLGRTPAMAIRNPLLSDDNYAPRTPSRTANHSRNSSRGHAHGKPPPTIPEANSTAASLETNDLDRPASSSSYGFAAGSYMGRPFTMDVVRNPDILKPFAEDTEREQALAVQRHQNQMRMATMDGEPKSLASYVLHNMDQQMRTGSFVE